MGYGKTSDTRKTWNYGQVDLTTAATVYHIASLCGGESITIKALSANLGNAYIGSDRLVSSSNGFELDSSETLTLILPITFGIDNYIDIFATTDNSGDNVCWVKLIDLWAVTSAAG